MVQRRWVIVIDFRRAFMSIHKPVQSYRSFRPPIIIIGAVNGMAMNPFSLKRFGNRLRKAPNSNDLRAKFHL